VIPLFAVETLEPDILSRLPGFKRRMDWFIQNRPDLTKNVARMDAKGEGERLLLSITNAEQLRRVLRIMLDEEQFLSPFGVRSLSRHHKRFPFVAPVNSTIYSVEYDPGESTTGMFGGNSNWRGPVWFPINFLIIESLQKLDHYYGDGFKVEYPSGSGVYKTLWDVATSLSRRLSSIFLPTSAGPRPAHGADSIYEKDPHWRDLVRVWLSFWTNLRKSDRTSCRGLSKTREGRCPKW
jgi:Glycosyl hydrolase family 63 C-terminal domain